MAGYLFDTNCLIYLLDEEVELPEQYRSALQDLEEKLENGNDQFFISPLIRYEFLRNTDWEDNTKLENFIKAISAFESLDISNVVSDLARDLYRFDVSESQQNNTPKNFEKRKFDMFHYATAKVNNLELLSLDSDLRKIDQMYLRMKNESI